MNNIFKSFLFLLCLQSVTSASLIVTNFVASAGDGNSGKSRWGYSSWLSDGYVGNSPTVRAEHWYEYGDGESYNAFVQVSLIGINNADLVESATLNVYLTAGSSDDTYLQFADQSSIVATGDAVQELGGTTIKTIGVTPAGWLTLDVTDEIKTDVAAGRSYSAFKFANSGYSSLTFATADNTDTSLHPSLTVSIPEPATITLISLAGSCFIIGRRCLAMKKSKG